MPAYDRALRYVEKIDGGCWEYQDRLDKHGYGRIDSSFVHRVFYQKLKGDIGGLCVLHKCDNPKCCNPDHLFLGTKADNTADMIAKGRMAVGEDLPHAKLTADKVREIRRKALAKTYVQKSERQTILALADEYGMSEHAIYQVIKRMNWKHVE